MTKRLKLIPFTKQDGDLLNELFTDPYVRKYLWDDEIIDMQTTRKILEKNEEYFNSNKWGMWKIVPIKLKKTIGFVGLWFFYDEPQPQLIYGLLKSFVGNGYATEASRRIVEYAFENLQFNYLIAAIDEPNVASQ